MDFIEWWNAAPKPENYFFGLHGYQWERIGTFLQAFAGSLVLFELVSLEAKQKLSTWANSKKRKQLGEPVRLTPEEIAESREKPMDPKAIGIYLGILVPLSAFIAALYLKFTPLQDSTGWQYLPDWPGYGLCLLLTGVFTIALMVMLGLVMMAIWLPIGVLILVYFILRYPVLDRLLSLLHFTRIDKAVTVFAVFLLVLGTLINLRVN